MGVSRYVLNAGETSKGPATMKPGLAVYCGTMHAEILVIRHIRGSVAQHGSDAHVSFYIAASPPVF